MLGSPELPEILVSSRHLRDNTEDAITALVAANDPPSIFVRAGQLVRIIRDEKGIPIIDPLNEASLRGIMDRAANYVKASRDDAYPVSPPLEIVRDIMGLASWPFPPLQAITEVPVISPSGGIYSGNGYNPETGLYHIPNPGLTITPIPEQPSEEDVVTATELLKEAICDFPFADQGDGGSASLANALATMITPIVRPLIDGPVPLALIDKPQAGTGATLLAEVVSSIATGRSAAMMSQPKDDEECRKKITSFLMAGRSIIVMDNVESRIYLPSLAALLTSTRWLDRILGRSEPSSIPNRSIWIATGNNIQLGGDLPRRCYWIRMDAKQARPWQRKGFRHPNLVQWCAQNRGELIRAALVLSKAWITNGKPGASGLPALGGFESWSETIGGILSYVGIEGFLTNLEAMYEEMDTETPQWEAFLEAWYKIWGSSPVAVSTITAYLESGAKLDEGGPDLKSVLPDQLADSISSRKSPNRVVGRALSARNGMRFPSGCMICKGSKKHQAVQWCVTRDGGDDGDGGGDGPQKKLPKLPDGGGDTKKTTPGTNQKQQKGELMGEFHLTKLPDSKGEGSLGELDSLPSRVKVDSYMDTGGNKLPELPNSPPPPDNVLKILRWLSREQAEHLEGIPLSVMALKVDDATKLNEYLLGMSRDGYVELGAGGIVRIAEKGRQYLGQGDE